MVAKKKGKKDTRKFVGKSKRSRPNRDGRRSQTDLLFTTLKKKGDVFRALSAALRNEGVSGRLVTIEIVPSDRPALRSANPESVVRACPEGQVLRLVCKRVKGTVICEEKCMPR